MTFRSGAGSGFNTEWLDFMDVKARGLGGTDKAEYYQCKATINLVKNNNSFYKACPTPECNKKVIEDSSTFRCEKCNADFPNFKYRLLISVSFPFLSKIIKISFKKCIWDQMSIADWSSNTWITLFSDHAEQLLQKTSQEVGEALEHTPELAEKYLASIAFKSYIFKMRAKVEVYGVSLLNN